MTVIIGGEGSSVVVSSEDQSIVISNESQSTAVSGSANSIVVGGSATITISSGGSAAFLEQSYEVGSSPVVAYRVLALVDGLLEHGTPFNPLDLNSVIGIGLESGNPGDTIRIATYGIVSNPEWNWLDDQLLFLGADGVIYTDPDETAMFVLSIGNAPSPTQINININEPELLP